LFFFSIFFVFKQFSIDTLASFFGALTFALHPIHTEAVSGVVGRAEVSLSS